MVNEPRGRDVFLGFFFTLLLSACMPFPIKSLALSTCVSSQTIHFQVLDKSPLLGPGRDPPSCNKTIKQPVVLQAKWVYSGTAKNHNVRCINLLQTTGKSREQK